jgi:CRISPR-associated protein Csx16
MLSTWELFMNYLVTRHSGALEWLRSHVEQPFIHIGHMTDLHILKQGDCVMGTLPLYLIAAVCVRGARYFHLDVELPDYLRGTELSAQKLRELNAELVEYSVLRHLPDDYVMGMDPANF